MRVLSQSDCHHISGCFFYPGYITDDLLIGGAFVGFVGAIGYNFAASFYPQRTDLDINTLKDIATSTIKTGLLGATYGVLLDGVYLSLCFTKDLVFGG